MTNFDPSNQTKIVDFIRKSLPRHNLMALATINPDGSPWVVCVNLTYDDEMNIYWKSSVSTVHSKNIARNNKVSICVFSHTSGHGDFGFYCNATARVITDHDEIMHILDVKYSQKNLPVPPVSDFLGESRLRLYCATLSECWINDDRHIKAPVDLSVLTGGIR